MAGVGSIALNSAPVLGGVMLALAAGQFRGPDYRSLIKQDMDLLERLPPEATERRAELQRTIDARIDDLIQASDRGQAMRKAATSYQGNWRDLVLFVCAVLFAIVWWNVNHSRANWLPTFVVLILLAMVAAGYAARGVFLAGVSLLRRGRPPQRYQQNHS